MARGRVRSYTGNPAGLPVDTHHLVGMVAPRGLFIMENPHIDWLAANSGSVAALGGAEIYKALGAGNNPHLLVRHPERQPLRDQDRMAGATATEHPEIPAWHWERGRCAADFRQEGRKSGGMAGLADPDAVLTAPPTPGGAPATIARRRRPRPLRETGECGLRRQCPVVLAGPVRSRRLVRRNHRCRCAFPAVSTISVRLGFGRRRRLLCGARNSVLG